MIFSRLISRAAIRFQVSACHNISVALCSPSSRVLVAMSTKGGPDDVLDVSQLRNPYYTPEDCFTEDKMVSKDPIKQFEAWLKDAAKNNRDEVNAVNLATVGADGRPSARMVLLKGYGPDGFRFYTNHLSRKGKELATNPYAAMVFYWGHIHRSIRVEGKVQRLAEKDAEEYFRTRPRASQIAAHLSTEQSRPIESRDYITKVDQELQEKFKGIEVPKPQYWGGYIVKPDSIEFWQGQSTRMHDRIRFRKKTPNDGEDSNRHLKEGANGWFYERLMP